MLRILHVVSRLSRNTGVMGFLMNYYRAMDKSRIQFDFLFFLDKDQDIYDEITLLGGKIYQITKPSLSISSIREIFCFFEEHRGEYQIVHNHEVYLTFILSPASKKYGVPYFISHSHTTRLSPRVSGRIRNGLLCLPVNRMSDFKFACSDEAGKALFRKHWGKSESKVIPNAINIERFKYNENSRERIRSELGLENKFVVGNVGRLEAGKNHQKLIEVFEAVHEKNPNSVLIILGEGPMRNEIEKLIHEKKLDASVRLLGKKANIQDYYQAMDMFLFTSIYEGLGIVIIEAQCSGVPCVVSTGAPQSVKINTNLVFQKLSDTSSIWAQSVLKNTKREDDGFINVATRGFDTESAKDKLALVYEAISDNRGIESISFDVKC